MWLIFTFITGLLTLVSVIFVIIGFANATKSKWTWLIVFLSSLIAMVVFLSLTVSAFVKKAKKFGDDFEQTVYKSYEKSAYNDYHFADSTNSKQLTLLRLLEPKDVKGSVPDQFYHYLGYLEYYRMPLRYPYSLHCNDYLENGTLYDESNVSNFNVNDNGEKECGVDYITEFTFDENILIAKARHATDLKKFSYIIYHFETGEKEEFTDLEQVKLRAFALQFTRQIKFNTCQNYFDLLQ
ncbi:MAG: hypothetical protein K0S32_131 [Bacteroidetes bacterium]|nr:hypothetical protein [Bacteroidota bacterium]